MSLIDAVKRTNTLYQEYETRMSATEQKWRHIRAEIPAEKSRIGNVSISIIHTDRHFVETEELVHPYIVVSVSPNTFIPKYPDWQILIRPHDEDRPVVAYIAVTNRDPFSKHRIVEDLDFEAFYALPTDAIICSDVSEFVTDIAALIRSIGWTWLDS